jgi:hypothetical protein
MKTCGVAWWIATIAIGVVSSACASSDEGVPVKPRQQWQGANSEVRAFAVRPVRSSADWETLWQQIGRAPPQAWAAGPDMAVAIFLGERRTGGYGVEIVSARATGGQLVVEYREKTPPPDAMVTQALTHPWAVALLPRSDATVTARKIEAGPSGR